MIIVTIPLFVAALVVAIAVGHSGAPSTEADPTPAPLSAAATPWTVAHAAVLDDRSDTGDSEISSTF